MGSEGDHSSGAKIDTRSKLLKAACELFAKHGYDGVSMRDIATMVGVRQSSIYNHFEGKQDILVDLMYGHMDRLLDAVYADLEGITAPDEKIICFARFHIGYHIRHRDDVFLANSELRSLEPVARDRVTKMRDAYEDIVRTTLLAGAEAGLFDVAHPAIHARAILAMLTGVVDWYQSSGPIDSSEVTETYLQVMLRGLGVKPA